MHCDHELLVVLQGYIQIIVSLHDVYIQSSELGLKVASQFINCTCAIKDLASKMAPSALYQSSAELIKGGMEGEICTDGYC